MSSNQIRASLAANYLNGSGIEVGALHNPFPVPGNLQVTYVDRISQEELRKHYPELGNVPFPLAVIDDGEKLRRFDNDTQDFIIASHFIEHSQDPIGTLKNFTRVLKPNGILLLVVPNRHDTFDRDRIPTSWDHVLNDNISGPENSYEEHLREWAVYVSKALPQDVKSEMDRLRSLQYSIHFHVWNADEFKSFLDKVLEITPFILKHYQPTQPEMFVVLQKINKSISI